MSDSLIVRLVKAGTPDHLVDEVAALVGAAKALEDRREKDRLRTRRRIEDCHPKRWATLTGEVLRRDGFKCRYCGDDASVADHVLPFSRGGETAMHNLAAACSKCNMRKGNKTVAEWRGPNER